MLELAFRDSPFNGRLGFLKLWYVNVFFRKSQSYRLRIFRLGRLIELGDGVFKHVLQITLDDFFE